ncbi:MAG: DeoR/GlpR family DNA-binding transcription regulator [Actinobacteria bacterium]|nr:DeoR/GlpR family DNA-binding transcription regulator [Actinomycetota bacterium]
MKQEKRLKDILEFLKMKDNYSIKELSTLFKIPIPTLYRDILKLEKEGLVRKYYGNIELDESKRPNTNYYNRLKINTIQKKSIAAEAAKYVENGDTIALDDSTSSYFLAQELNAKDINLQIITNSATIPLEFVNNKKIQVINPGGFLNFDIMCYSAPLLDFKKINLHAKYFFFSMHGVDPEKGVLEIYLPEVIGMKNYLRNMADKAICLADSSKFDKKGTINWIRWSEIDKIITDDSISKDKLNSYLGKGIKIIIAK